MIRNVNRFNSLLTQRLQMIGNRLSLLLCLLIIVQVPASSCFKKKIPPEWVSAVTVSESGYFTGVGYAVKNKRQKDHEERARKDALNELAASVSVTINSSNTWITVENNEKVSDDYRSLIQARVSTELENVELVSTYEDKKGYWVYYRLSKQRYSSTVASRKQQASVQGVSFYMTALQAEAAGDYRQAIVLYARAADAVKQYINEPVLADVQGREVNLSVNPFERINAMLGRIELRAPLSRLDAVYGSELSTSPLSVSVLNDDGMPVKSFPLLLWYSERAVNEPVKRTDSSGAAQFTLPRTRSEKNSELIMVSPDLNTLMAEAAVDFSVRRAVLSMAVQNLIVSVHVRKPTFNIQLSSATQDRSLHEELVLPVFSGIVIQQGYQLVPQADFLCVITTSSRVTEQRDGIVKVQLSGSFQLFDKSQKLIATIPIAPVTGSQLTMEGATRQAYQTFALQLERRYFTEMKLRF